MNYIREINAFYDWLETNLLSTSGIVLWHALMAINNKAGWAAEFGVATSVLCVRTGLASRTISKARNELKQKGRIDWRQRKGNQSALYKIIPLSASNACNHADKCADKTFENSLSAPNADNHADNHADKCADNHADNHATLIKLNETKLNKTTSSSSPTLKIKSNLQNMGIHAPSHSEIQKLELWTEKGMDLDTVLFAIETSALANKRRVDYVYGILRNWYRAGIQTKQQAEAEMEQFKQGKDTCVPNKRNGLTEDDDQKEFFRTLYMG